MYIVATISKNSYTAEKIEKIIQAGAQMLRFNFSHGSPEEMLQKIQVAKDVIARLNLEDQVQILADLPGAKIRLGNFPGGEYVVSQGQEVTFKSAEFSPNPTEYVPINLPEVSQYVTENEEISFGDGEIGFRVTKIIDTDSFLAVALNSRYIPEGKGVNFGQAVDKFDHLTKNTLQHIENLKKIQPDLVAFSFINSREVLVELKKFLNEYYPNNTIRIVSKIESSLGLENIEGIIDETDIIMIARGDLGLTTPYEQLGLQQKKLIRLTKERGKEVIVATQLLDSLLDYYIPSRAEISDLTSIVLEGADGIMMAKETGISATPEHSVATAKKIIDFVENNRNSL